MTCIVGISTPNGVFLGADSAGIAGYNVTVRADRKLFRRDNFIFGFAGSFRAGQLLKYNLRIPPYRYNLSEHEYLHQEFLESMRSTLAKGGNLLNDRGSESYAAICLFGFGGRLYAVEPDFQIAQSVDSYMAIGCGAEVALGSLYSSGDQSPEERIRLALEASQRYNAGVRSPFYLISSDAQTQSEGVELQASSQVAAICSNLDRVSRKFDSYLQ
jgi:20S proteasome alpha/beta subunit